MLHYQGEKFKQLFIIQFNTLFSNGNSLRFTKDHIDGVCKDLRYPAEFFIDIIFDNDKNIQSNNFEEDVIKWKNIISDFIVKGDKNNAININSANKDDLAQNKQFTLINDIPIENENKNKGIKSNKAGYDQNCNKEKIKENKNDRENLINENKEKDEKQKNHQFENDLEHDEDEGHNDAINTLDKANEILQKFNQGKTDKNEANEEEEDDEENLDDYIKNLQN